MSQLLLPNIPRPRTTPRQNRHEQLVRVLRLMQLIAGRPCCPPLDVLAAHIGVCDRTVRRYLDAMSLAGLPVPPLFTEYQRESSEVV